MEKTEVVNRIEQNSSELFPGRPTGVVRCGIRTAFSAELRRRQPRIRQWTCQNRDSKTVVKCALVPDETNETKQADSGHLPTPCSLSRAWDSNDHVPTIQRRLEPAPGTESRHNISTSSEKPVDYSAYQFCPAQYCTTSLTGMNDAASVGNYGYARPAFSQSYPIGYVDNAPKQDGSPGTINPFNLVKPPERSDIASQASCTAFCNLWMTEMKAEFGKQVACRMRTLPASR